MFEAVKKFFKKSAWKEIVMFGLLTMLGITPLTKFIIGGVTTVLYL